MMDKRELLRRIDAGETFEYHFFWKGVKLMNEDISLKSYYFCEKCNKSFADVSSNYYQKYVYFNMFLTDKPNSQWCCQCGGYLQFERVCWGGIILCA